MDTLPNEDLNSGAKLTNAKKSMRRKRDEKELATQAHVVVTTTPLKTKIVKPEGKKLRRKLHEFEQENETLTKTVMEKNMEITALKTSVASLNEVLNSVPIDELRYNSSIASSKILDLSKKNRSLRAELESLKNRLNKKDSIIEKLDRETKSLGEKIKENADLSKRLNKADDVHAKANNLQQKLFETRNKNLELQNQLKLAHKWLQQEIGENININTFFTNHQTPPGWRGRAQQILALQQKLQELRARLEVYEDRLTDHVEYFTPVPPGTEIDISTTIKAVSSRSQISVACAGDSQTNVATFDRFTPGVRKSELLHRAKVDALEKEIATLNTQLDEQKSKILALKVRNKTLNDEMTKYKLKTNALEEQTDYNGYNIQTMNEKLSKQRLQYENRLEDMRGDLVRITEERDGTVRKMEELSHKNLELETTLKEKETFIEQLQNIIKRLETDLLAISGGFLFSCREFRKEEYISILDALEVEKNQLLLHNKKLDERLIEEREKNTAIMEQVAKQKIRITRLENKLHEMEKELDTQSERRKRTQRMADYANSLSHASINGSLSSFTFENQSIYTSTQSLNKTNDQAKVEDLKNQLELANEKINILTEKLTFISDEKQTDAKFFEETLINSKTIILDTILNKRDFGDKGSAEENVQLLPNTEFVSHS